MPQITFIAHDGQQRWTVQAAAGTSLMQAAVDHRVPGIDGDCGGNCACATCHVFITAPWNEATGHRSAREDEMLAASADLRDSSRLGCQVVLTDAMDGLQVQLPEGQH